jgi:DNA-binding transcriptional LysR family regulator
MLEFRNLSHLLVACEHENLTVAAEDLGIAPSTLSASLKSLETEFGLPLFKRLSGGLYPRSSARWLFRAGLILLLLESHTRRRLATGPQARSRVLTINIRPLFTIGRITKGVLRAITATAIEDPTLFINPIWTEDEPTPFDTVWIDKLGFRDAGALSLRLEAPETSCPKHQTELLRDPWVLAYHCPATRARGPTTAVDLSERTLIVPAFSSPELSEKVERLLIQYRIKRVKSVPYHPGSLPRLVTEHPDSTFLLPSSALAGRLGLLHVRSTPLDPPLISRLVAGIDRPGEAADAFMTRLKRAFDSPDSATIFNPRLSARKVRYFNLAFRIRSVSAAARIANVAQPALGEQLRKLELTLGGRLFDRHSDGVSPSPLGYDFAPASQMLEDGLQSLKNGGLSRLSSDGGRLSLGVLPSVSQHGLLVNRIADTICEIQSAFPALTVTVQEAGNRTLQDWVTRGSVGLAIVETGPLHMPRLPLGSSEPLALIAHPRHNILSPGPVRLADLARLRLALPSSLSGLRQLLDSAAQGQRIKLRPAMEVDALPMLIALLQREPICTVLPISAVRKELNGGELCANAIVEPQVLRSMFVIYSGERTLTEPEREFVRLLRERLGDIPPSIVQESLPDPSAAPLLFLPVRWPATGLGQDMDNPTPTIGSGLTAKAG